MKLFSIILVIFAIFAIALASDARKKDFSDAAHPGKCVINKDLILDAGTHHPDPNDKCISYHCEENGMATIFTSSPEGCSDVPTPSPPPA